MKSIRSILLLFFCSVFAFSMTAQNGSISGTLTDEKDEPMIGATIMVEETGNGVVTDLDGKYEITDLKPGTYNLVFSFVGYEDFKSEVKVASGEKKTLNHQMKPDAKILDDLVVVGYGTERKRDLTGSIAKISSDELNDVSGASFETALQGKAAGVQIIQSSGIAGAGAVVRIRGIGSVTAGGDPLYVVDGIPITQDPFLNGDRGGQNNNPLSSINPNDIESIEVLKDASAAAIYGSRGANGVVLITTKRGKPGKPVFNFSTRFGVSQPASKNKVQLLDTDEWLQLRQEAWENDGNVGQAPLPLGISWEEAQTTNTDWVDAVLETGMKQEYNFSMSQGKEKIKTYIGANYLDVESYMIGNSYERISGRVNIDYNVIENLTFNISTNLVRGKNNRIHSAWDGGLGTAQSTALPYYNPDSLYWGGNPVRKQNLVDWNTIELKSINSFGINYRPIKDLELIGTGFVEYVKIDDNIYEDSLLDITNGNSYAKLWRTKVYNFQGTGLAKYTFSKLPEAHRLTAMVGGEIQQYTTRSRFTEGGNLDGHIYEDPEFTKPEPDGWLVRNPATESIWTFMSAFTRIKYVYQDKLIVSGSFRTDGSSKFGPDNRYGFFPSAGVGYIMSEEQFLADNDAINFLKLKASWGITGNADIPWKKQFGLFGEPAPDSYNGDTSIFPLQLAKPDLSWETTTTFDAGFEIGFLNDRITTEFAFYNKLSKDVLIDTRIQASTGIFDDGGAHNFLKNIGEIRNRGVEFSITTRNLVGKFKWKTTLNIGHNKNKVLDLGITAPDAIAGPGDTRVIVGHAVGVNYLVRFSHVDSETGLPVYLDKDGNETFEFNEDNRVIVGNVHPDFTGGITNTFEFKNFDLSFLWTFSYGGNIYDDAAKRQLGVFSDWNMRVEIMDRWTQPGDDATYPKLTLDPGTYGLASEWANNTDLWLYDASYLRLKTLTLGYDVPIKDGKSKGFRKARVYVMGTNLVTFTEYPGWDPEIVRDHNGPQGRNVAPNVTYLTPPQERTISFGVDLQF